jgi:DNA polymerase (family 10)
MAPLSKDQIADTLESIARMLELKGENVFKIRAYTNAARALETFSGDLAAAAAENRLGEIPGVGKAIADKITELVTTGELVYFNKLKAQFPEGVFEMFELQGLGPKKIKALWEILGITTVPELEAACKDGRVAALAGFGKKTADNILNSIQSRAKHAGRFRLGEIASDAERMLENLKGLDEVLQVCVAGSYRRRKEIVGDLDFIVATNAPAEVSEFFVKHEMVESVLAHGATKSSVRFKNGIQADLRVVKNNEYPFALNYFTGSKEHNIIMRQRALARGWTLNEYRLGPIGSGKADTAGIAEPAGAAEPAHVESGAPAAASTAAGRAQARAVKSEPPPPIREECDLYSALGLEYVAPELREDRGEFAAAENHTLPDLVEIENLRGTFHNHTTASDGRSSLEEMAAAAQELGLDYLGIADHSKSSFQAHGLDAKALQEQAAKIRAMNLAFSSFRLFAGSEVDILKDGTLDFPDEVLAQLDYTVVSVHSVFNLTQAEMTKRIIRAISNPHVTMLGHLTGRLLLSRDAYQVDIPAIIEAAAETGTIIELNANPRRLDMDWRWWPLAKEKAVKCAINPDAHHTDQLQFLWFGIGAARKGWLTRNDVVNTLPLGKIEAALASKRTRSK